MKMMIDDMGDIYDKCLTNGRFHEKDAVDIELIRSIKDVSEKSLSFINERSIGIKKDSTDWTFVFREYYESLRGFIESFLLFDRIEVESHQCKNAYICIKHPELELDWEFLEMIRLKRNAINYKGYLLNYDDWSMLKIQFDLHIMILKEGIEKRLKAVGR